MCAATESYLAACRFKVGLINRERLQRRTRSYYSRGKKRLDALSGKSSLEAITFLQGLRASNRLARGCTHMYTGKYTKREKSRLRKERVLCDSSAELCKTVRNLSVVNPVSIQSCTLSAPKISSYPTTSRVREREEPASIIGCLKTARSECSASRGKNLEPAAFNTRPGIAISREHGAEASAFYGDAAARRPAVQHWWRWRHGLGKARAQGRTRPDVRNLAGMPRAM